MKNGQIISDGHGDHDDQVDFKMDVPVYTTSVDAASLSVTSPDLANNPDDIEMEKQYDAEGDKYDGTANGFIGNASANLVIYESDKVTQIHKGTPYEGKLIEGKTFCEQGLYKPPYYITGNVSGTVSSRTTTGLPTDSAPLTPTLNYHKVDLVNVDDESEITKINGILRIVNPYYFPISSSAQHVDGDAIQSFPVKGTSISGISAKPRFILGLEVCGVSSTNSDAQSLQDWNAKNGYTIWTSDNTDVATVDDNGIVTLTGNVGLLSIHGKSTVGLPEISYKRNIVKSFQQQYVREEKNEGADCTDGWKTNHDKDNLDFFDDSVDDWGNLTSYGWEKVAVYANNIYVTSSFNYIAMWNTYDGSLNYTGDDRYPTYATTCYKQQ
ncbi:hypothetical protein ABNH60_003537 [Salmonella enterica]